MLCCHAGPGQRQHALSSVLRNYHVGAGRNIHRFCHQHALSVVNDLNIRVSFGGLLFIWWGQSGVETHTTGRPGDDVSGGEGAWNRRRQKNCVNCDDDDCMILCFCVHIYDQ